MAIVRELKRAARPLSTWELQTRAMRCAVGTCVSELRQQGYDIRSRRTQEPGEDPVWYYTYVSGPK